MEDREGQYFEARERLRASIDRMLRDAQVKGVSFTIDGERASRWEGLHEVAVTSAGKLRTVLMLHTWFMEPHFITTHVLPLVQGAIESVTRQRLGPSSDGLPA